MPPITIKNIQQVDYRASNALRNQAIKGITGGLDDIAGLVQDREDLQRKDNTALATNEIKNMTIDQLREAQSSGRFANITGNVDVSAISNALQGQEKRAQDKFVSDDAFATTTRNINERGIKEQHANFIANKQYPEAAQLLADNDLLGEAALAKSSETSQRSDYTYNRALKDDKYADEERDRKEARRINKDKAHEVMSRVVNTSSENYQAENELLRTTGMDARFGDDANFVKNDEGRYEFAPTSVNDTPEAHAAAAAQIAAAEQEVESTLKDPRSVTRMLNDFRKSPEYLALKPDQRTAMEADFAATVDPLYNLNPREAEKRDTEITRLQTENNAGYDTAKYKHATLMKATAIAQQHNQEDEAITMEQVLNQADVLAPDGSWLPLWGDGSGKGGSGLKAFALKMQAEGAKPYQIMNAMKAAAQTKEEAWGNQVVDEAQMQALVNLFKADTTDERRQADIDTSENALAALGVEVRADNNRIKEELTQKWDKDNGVLGSDSKFATNARTLDDAVARTSYASNQADQARSANDVFNSLQGNEPQASSETAAGARQQFTAQSEATVQNLSDNELDNLIKMRGVNPLSAVRGIPQNKIKDQIIERLLADGQIDNKNDPKVAQELDNMIKQAKAEQKKRDDKEAADRQDVLNRRF